MSDNIIHKQIIAPEVKALENGSYDIVISTDGVDRDGDVIEQDGWEFDNYLLNPVVLFGHDYRSVPIGMTNRLSREGGKTVANFTFRQPANDFDPVLPVKSAWDQGMLRAASVGFRPKEAEPLDKDDDGWFAPQRYMKQELLEWSIVPIPANQEALRREFEDFIKSLGIPGVRNLQEAAENRQDNPNNADTNELNEAVVEGLTGLIRTIQILYSKE
jgi:phage head maturation protease